MSAIREKVIQLTSLLLSNGVSLLASLTASMAVLRLLDRNEFAAWTVALSFQALASIIPIASGPSCARWLAIDANAEASCLRVRSHAGWLAGSLFALAGMTWTIAQSGDVSPLAWGLLGLQIPGTAIESHRAQTLQMSRKFHLQALYLPLSRITKSALLWAAIATGHHGLESVALLQVLSQIISILPGWKRTIKAREKPSKGFMKLWYENLIANFIVWNGTRSAVVFLSAKSSHEDTARYGIADTICTSLQLPIQALGMFLQPNIYSWSPKQGAKNLLRAGALTISLSLILFLISISAGSYLLEILAGKYGDASIRSLNILGVGIVAIGVSVVPGVLLQRHGAGKTIVFLELISAISVLLGLLYYQNPSAENASFCWSAGRWVWAIGATSAAFYWTRLAIKKHKE